MKRNLIGAAICGASLALVPLATAFDKPMWNALAVISCTWLLTAEWIAGRRMGIFLPLTHLPTELRASAPLVGLPRTITRGGQVFFFASLALLVGRWVGVLA